MNILKRFKDILLKTSIFKSINVIDYINNTFDQNVIDYKKFFNLSKKFLKSLDKPLRL